MHYRPDPSSWYKSQKAVPEGSTDDFFHANPPQNDEVLKVIKPIYENSSSENLLRNVRGHKPQIIMNC